MKLSILLHRIFSLSVALTFVNTECDRFYSEVLESEGFLSSYNYPFEYRHNLACRYTFYGKPRPPNQGAKICFIFHKFDIELNVPFCLFDFLEFQSSPPIKYCSNGVWQYGMADTDYPQSSLTSGYSCWNVKNKFVLKFSSDNSSNGRGFYATYKILDSSEVEPTTEPGGRAETGKTLMKCDFSWRSKEDDVENSCPVNTEGWKRTESLFLGSTFIEDHTVGAGGSFLLSSKNMKSLLLGPEIPLNPDLRHCLTFWFLFASPQSPGLRVFLSRDQMHALAEWESRPTGVASTWRLAEISLSELTSVQVAIATDVPDSHWPEGSLGVVAVDDLSISVGPCGKSDISCNFESSNCDWLALERLEHGGGVLVAEGTWQRQVKTLDHDHEEDFRGSYITTVALEDHALTRSLLVSPQVTSSFEGDLGLTRIRREGNGSSFYHACFKFFYRFHGDGRGLSRLNVRVVGHDDRLTSPLWSAANRLRGNWVAAAADLVLQRDKPYKILLESLLRSDSQIMLDGFSFDPESCTTPTSECLSMNSLQCDGDLCLEASKVCDGKVDCEDGSDEDETVECPEGHGVMADLPTSVDGLNPDSSVHSADHNSTPQNGINVLAISLSSSVLGLSFAACLVLAFVCLAKRNKARTAQKSPGKNREKTVSDGANRDEDVTVYQTLSASNQSSANLCWLNGEERGLRTARCSSSSEDGSDVAIVNVDERTTSNRRPTDGFEAAPRSDLPLRSTIRCTKRDASRGEPSASVLDARALGGHAPVPLIVTSKYIISPDKAGAFGPGSADRHLIDRMIDSYWKDPKIPDKNFGNPSDASDHVYEDIDEAKAGVGVRAPFQAGGGFRPDLHAFPGIVPQVVLEKDDTGMSNGQSTDSSIISKAILV